MMASTMKAETHNRHPGTDPSSQHSVLHAFEFAIADQLQSQKMLLSPLEHQPTCSGEELEDHQSHLVTTTSRNLGRCVFLNRMSGLVQRKPGNK
ncbi:hypothetical protein V6Z12_D11G145000 [Gossypium hirsutum]